MNAELWYEKLQESTTLPFATAKFSSEEKKEDPLFYALELVNFDFKKLPDGDNYLLNLCLFDFKTRRFGGSQWTQHCAAHNSKIELDQHLFFRSLASKDSLVIVVELGERRQKNSLCWTAIPLGGISQPIEPESTTDSSSIRKQLRKNFPLYAGSCRVLQLASTGFNQLEPHLRRLEAILSLSLRLIVGKSLHAVRHIPAFHFLHHSAIGNAEKMAKFTVQLDNLRLSFLGGGQRAADNFLLDLLAREFCYVMNKKWQPGEPPSGLRVLERRLKVGAHDGIGFMERPICLLLESLTNTDTENPQNPSGIRRRSRSLGGRASMADSSNVDFGVRQTVRLLQVPLQPELAIVFELNYLVGCPMGDANAQDLFANARLIRVAWAAWSPFSVGDGANLNQMDKVVTLQAIRSQLLGGPRPSPFSSFGGGLCLRALSILPTIGGSMGQWPPLPAQKIQMDLHFNFVPFSEGDGPDVPQSQRQIAPSLPKSGQLPAAGQSPRRPSKRPPSAPSSQMSARPTVELSPPPSNPSEQFPLQVPSPNEEDGANEGEGALLWPQSTAGDGLPSHYAAPPIGLTGDDGTPPFIPIQKAAESGGGTIRVELPLARVHPLPRSMIAQLAKFPALNSTVGLPTGPPPKPVDVQRQQQWDLALETVPERRWPISEFAIQFLAFLPAQNGFPRAQSPPRLFFTFEFFRSEQLVTECLFAEPNEGGQQPPHHHNQPMLLWREGATQPGLMTRFTVGAEQRVPFAQYLFGNQLHLHVWEADSLFHLGIASIPLKFLLRQGSSAVQCSFQCPVFQAGFPPSWQPAGGPTLNGLLFLRMANFGLSSTLGTTTNSLQSNPKRVQSLRSGQQSPLERFFALQRLDMAQRNARLFGPEENARIQQWNQLKLSSQIDTNKSAAQLPNMMQQPQGGTKGEKFIFAEELTAYKALRREGKAMALLRAVFSSITTRISVDIELGQLHLFPFQLRNSLAEDFVCELESNDPRVGPIIAPDELKYFRQQRGGGTRIGGHQAEGETIWQAKNANKNSKNPLCWQFGLRALEMLELPMRLDPGMDERRTEDQQQQQQQECIRVFCRRLPSGHPVAILEITIRVHSPFLAHDLRWFTEECRKLVRTVPLPPKMVAHSVQCSDPTVHCFLMDAGRCLRLECQTGESPLMRHFLLFLYGSPLALQLQAVWRISIHSLGRLHAETVQGHPIRVPLPLPPSMTASGAPDGELIRLHCSPPFASLRFHPAPVFPAAQFGIIQPAILLNPSQLGSFHLLLSAVHVSALQPAGQWLLSLSVGQPNVTKVFQVIVPAQMQQKIVQKRIPLDNPLAIQRQFRLSSSDSNILSVPMPSPPPVPPNSSMPIQLNIHPPANRPAQCQALLFVQDAQTGQQEEAFQLNIRFH